MFCALAGPAAPGALAAPEKTKPNILLIMTDDMGVWDLGSSGNRDIDTPALDKLAQESVSFARYYAAPVCSPTRAGLMTGRYALRTGLYNTRFGGDSLGRNEITLAQVLKAQGYRTGLFGKWHLGRYPGYQPHQRGFDEFLGHYEGHIERYEFADQLVHNGHPVESRGYVTDLFTDAALEFIGTSSQQGAPFFCFLSFNAPHSPFLLETSHAHLAEGDALISKYLKRGLALREARIYAMVERVDSNVARLLAQLAARGLDRDTVVLFMSDNGGVSRHWNAGLRGRKASTYEGGVLSPLFVRWPGRFPAGAVVRAQTSHVDIFPTLCELAGASLPTDRVIDGRSFLPLLKAGAGESHQPFVYHVWDRLKPDPNANWAISDQRYKLVGPARQRSGEAPPWQLFDLANDPGEKKDISAAHPEIVAALRREFERWFADVTHGLEYAPVPIPVGHAAEDTVELQPSWATLDSGVQYDFEGYDWDTLHGWPPTEAGAEWKLEVLQAGKYEVLLAYGCAPSATGSRIFVRASDQEIAFTPSPTTTANVFIRTSLGEITLKEGRQSLRLAVRDAPRGDGLRVNRLWLRRLP